MFPDKVDKRVTVEIVRGEIDLFEVLNKTAHHEPFDADHTKKCDGFADIADLLFIAIFGGIGCFKDVGRYQRILTNRFSQFCERAVGIVADIEDFVDVFTQCRQ